MRRDVPRRVFRGRDLITVSAQARKALGDDVLVLKTSTVRAADATQIEIVAAPANDVARFRTRLTPGPFGHPSPRRTPGPMVDGESATPSHSTMGPGFRRGDGEAPKPFVLALVGPTGAGKTTTAVKLAVHREALGGRTVGFITLDTYRAGAVAQLETYAGVANMPLEVVYDVKDVAGAMARLAHCDAIIVDTPGRGPKAGDDDQWRALLAAIAPDEVHLVIPATLRGDVAEAVRERVPEATHLLLTKLDEVPDETGVANLAGRLDLPVRWITDGQAIPTDLAAGVPRLIAALAAGSAFGEAMAEPVGAYAGAWA